MRDWPKRGLMALVRGYRLLLSPWLGSSCRFEPTCSVYSLQALERHGAMAGMDHSMSTPLPQGLAASDALPRGAALGPLHRLSNQSSQPGSPVSPYHAWNAKKQHMRPGHSVMPNVGDTAK